MAGDSLRPNTGVCNWCGGQIPDQKKIGTTKKFCSAKCRSICHRYLAEFSRYSWSSCVNDGCNNRIRNKSSKHCNSCYTVMRDKKAGVCTIHKCDRPAVRVGHGLCEVHYTRVRRTGSPDIKLRVISRRVEGYIQVKILGHPLVTKSGWALQHRIVAYEKYGPGQQRCHWCSIDLEWSSVVVDHLNEIKDDNDPVNLVTACNTCNRARGAMIGFIRSLTDDKLSHLIETFAFMRSNRFTCEKT